MSRAVDKLFSQQVSALFHPPLNNLEMISTNQTQYCIGPSFIKLIIRLDTLDRSPVYVFNLTYFLYGSLRYTLW